MATYYPNTSSQIDVLSAPYVRDAQKFTSYSEQPLLHGTMMMYLNPASSATSFADISPGSTINPHNEMMFIPPTSDPMCIQTMNDAINQGTGQSIGDGGERSFQGLSLSLSTQMSTAVSSASFQYQYYSNPPGLSSVLSPHIPLSAENNEVSASNNKELRNSDYFAYDIHGDGPNSIRFGEPNNSGQYEMNTKVMSMNPYQYEQVGVGGTIMRSKYLKATQQLLDEVVSVCDVLKRNESEKEKNRVKSEEGYKECKDGIQSGLETNESSAGSGSSRELSPVERQELQGKLDKLHSLLDEVDKRYKHYCHQMQILVSSFDMVVGTGASKPYTALALKTISRHFRCLRDAITGQIQSTRKSLGEQDNVLGVIPRLRYVDQQLRQQRALQQFGMMRHAWRPQRGLPENAVTVLRAWLFEHFLHPYPKDSEKIMLARQTGLTRSQVANWFINARVRLWKPMIEEMYKEEFGEAEINTRSPQHTPRPTREKSWGSEDRIDQEMHETTASLTNTNHDIPHSSNTDPNPSSDNKGFASSGFHMGAFTSNGNRGFYTNGSISNDHNGGAHVMVTSTVGGGYQIQELDSFSINNNNNNNQVSLALGLRHREGETNNTTMGNGTPEFPYMEQVNQQQQHRFGNPHILNDFVA